MLSYRNKYIIYLLLLNGLLTAVFVGWGRTVFSDSRSVIGITAAIVLLFFYELFVIFYTESKSKNLNSKQSVNLILGFKVGRTLLSLLIIAVYAAIVKVELKYFIILFFILYFFYLLFDTMYLTQREKRFVAKDLKNKEIEKISN